MADRINRLLDRYGESHRHPINKRIHWFCVPLIMWSLLGLSWLVPVPAGVMRLNGAIIIAVPALIYYLNLAPGLAAGMLPVVIVMFAIIHAVEKSGAGLPAVSLMVFVLAWIGQFIGHTIEGKRPSFLEDIRFLLIGPLWLLASVYRKLGIRIR